MSEGLPTRKKILELSGDMLKWQVYAIHTYPTDGLEAVMANTGPHLEYQHKIEKEGVYIAAGPHWADDEETWEGEGLIIIRAKDLSDARRIAEEDPMHSSGARSFKVRPWLINEGSITVKVNFASNSREVS